MEAVNLARKFEQIRESWKPRIAAELNGQHVKLVKFTGEFVWHHHEHEDEMFLVVRGHMRMQFRERTVVVGPGEFIVVPAGVEHCPAADEETHVVLFEPKSTLNTGNVTNDHTLRQIETI
jgi:mannose-6-phosphate isomerase-like protein (cupin superfamily)